VAQMQGIMLDFRRQINAELDAMNNAEMKDAIVDLRQLQREVEELRRQVNPQQLIDEGRRAAAEVERSFKPRSQVPPGAAGAPESSQAQAPLPRAVDVPEDPE